MKTIIMLRTIPLLVLIPTVHSLHAMIPYQDGKEQGKIDALGNVRDSIDACSKYSGIYSGKYNDNSIAATQCYHAYDLAFNQTCLAHPSNMVKDKDPDPEYPTCYDYLYK